MSMLTPPERMHVRFLLSLAALATAYLSLRVYPDELPPLSDQPGVIETLFQSQIVIFVARLTFLCVAGFVVLSIVARISNRQWLIKAGPFEVSTALSDFERKRDALAAELTAARATIARLEMERGRRTVPRRERKL